MRSKVRWRLPLLLLLAAALGITLLVIEIQDRQNKRHLETIQTEAAALERQRDELVARRDRNERDYQARAKVSATEQLLFLEADERAVEFPVSFEGIAPGKYKVRFVIDEAKYDTGATLEIGRDSVPATNLAFMSS